MPDVTVVGVGAGTEVKCGNRSLLLSVSTYSLWVVVLSLLLVLHHPWVCPNVAAGLTLLSDDERGFWYLCWTCFLALHLLQGVSALELSWKHFVNQMKFALNSIQMLTVVLWGAAVTAAPLLPLDMDLYQHVSIPLALALDLIQTSNISMTESIDASWTFD